MTSSYSLSDAYRRFIPRIEDEMRSVIQVGAQPLVFNTMLNYHLGFADSNGTPVHVPAGKRIRPVLTLLSCEACHGDWQMALPAAAAIELLHNFSLIHDDIEDRDELRRGRPTLWKLWGEAQAINAGDAMFALAHLALLRSAGRGVPADRVVRAMQAFDAMCVQLTIGQHLDLSFESRSDVSAEEYVRMIGGKTAALITAACEIGAIIAGANDEQQRALARFGYGLGLSFQLQDDVLGIWGDPTQTGKNNSDLAHGKKTLPVIYAAERDAALRARYFSGHALDAAALADIQRDIERNGGRRHTEEAAYDAFATATAALDALEATPAREALRALAESLLGRAQ